MCTTYSSGGAPATQDPCVRSQYLCAALVLAWGLAVILGWHWLWTYAGTAGRHPFGAQAWPAESHVQRAHARPTMLVFVHPHCPCSRATVAELATVMAHCQGEVDTTVLFYRPDGSP